MRTIFPPFPYLIWKVSLGWELFLFILWDTSKAPREIKVYSCRETKFATLKSLWHEDYFKLETIKPKRLRKKCWPSPIDSSGLPWWLSKESACQCRRHRFNPLVRETSWRRKQQPTPVFLPWEIPWTKEPGRLQSMGHKESDTSEHVRTHDMDYLKNVDRGLVPGREPSSQTIWCEPGMHTGNLAVCLLKSSVSHCLCWPRKHLFT